MYFIVPTVSVQFGSHGSRSVLSNQSFRLLPKLLSKRWSGPYVALRSPFGMPQTEERLRRFLPKQEELWVRRKRRDGEQLLSRQHWPLDGQFPNFISICSS